MGIEFLQDTMGPMVGKFEAEYTNKIFQLPSEESFYAEYNMDAYLRADTVAKAEAFARNIYSGIKTPNEIRRLNNDPAMDGGDDLFMQSGTLQIKNLEKLVTNKNQAPAQRQSLRKKIEKQVRDGIDPQLIIEGIFGNDGKQL
jgi:hypothetical protein